MKIKSFKILNKSAFIIQIVILLIVLLVIGESIYLYADYKNDNLAKQGEFLNTLSPTPVSTIKIPSITVLSPNGGEKMVVGNKYEIKWLNTSGSNYIRLFLMPGNVPITSLANAASKFTSPYSWTVPITLLPGQYKIEARLYSVSGDVPTQIATDLSDNYFTITTSQKIVTEKLSDATKNKYYEVNIQTEGFATSSLKWQIINGALPTGMHIQNQDVYCLPVYPGNCSAPDSVLSGGMISGKPTQEGKYTFTVKVSNETQSATKSYSINVVNQPNPPVQLITVVSPNGREQLVSNSIHQIKWNYPNATSTSNVDLYLEKYYSCPDSTTYYVTPCIVGVSPAIVLDKNIAVNTPYYWIVGTDIVNNIISPGYYVMKICIAGTTDCDVSNKPFEIISLNSSSRIDPASLPNAPVTSYYSQSLEVFGFSTSTITWQIVSGSLPPGFYLEKAYTNCTQLTSGYSENCPQDSVMFMAMIHGKPAKAGNYNFTVKASNGTQSATKNYSLNLY